MIPQVKQSTQPAEGNPALFSQQPLSKPLAKGDDQKDQPDLKEIVDVLEEKEQRALALPLADNLEGAPVQGVEQHAHSRQHSGGAQPFFGKGAADKRIKLQLALRKMCQQRNHCAPAQDGQQPVQDALGVGVVAAGCAAKQHRLHQAEQQQFQPQPREGVEGVPQKNPSFCFLFYSSQSPPKINFFKTSRQVEPAPNRVVGFFSTMLNALAQVACLWLRSFVETFCCEDKGKFQ